MGISFAVLHRNWSKRVEDTDEILFTRVSEVALSGIGQELSKLHLIINLLPLMEHNCQLTRFSKSWTSFVKNWITRGY